MRDPRFEQTADLVRAVLDWMAPAASDTVVARAAKVTFGISAVAMVTSAATVLVTAPRTQLSAA